VAGQLNKQLRKDGVSLFRFDFLQRTMRIKCKLNYSLEKGTALSLLLFSKTAAQNIGQKSFLD
jgi:hypothetical protein